MDRNAFKVKARAFRVVATREGGVDRNTGTRPVTCAALRVATREGGVDRNFGVRPSPALPGRVATREGGVDRNYHFA